MAEQEEPVRRRVALKIIKLGMDTRQVIARFEAERQALAMMDHPNIARVLDGGATETGRPYFVMELVRGIKITEYCDQNNLSTVERLRLFIQVCNAIQHAHQKGIIHRDIKPSNVMVTLHDGTPVPKVIDFGVAKATNHQRLTDKTVFTAFEQFIGTPVYMSPEQAEMSGLDIDTRSDIYSLGVLLYELLTGKTPFDADALMRAGLDECRRTIRNDEPARPSTRVATMLQVEMTTTASRRCTEPPRLIHMLRGDLDWVVMKCLEKDRARRYATANAVAVDVQRYLEGEPVSARPPSGLYRFQKFVRRNSGAFVAGAAVAGTLLLGAGISIWQAVRATHAENEAHKAQLAEAQLRRQAETGWDKAREQAALARLNEYVADVNLVNQALVAGNYGRAVQLLEKHRPQAGMPDQRGFEWRFLWQLSRGDEHAILTSEDSEMMCMAASPSGDLLAVGCPETVDIYDIRTKERRQTLPKGAFSAQFSADGKLLLTASRANVRIWSTSDWTEQRVLEGVSGPIALSADGRRLACSGRGWGRGDRGGGGGVCVWNTVSWVQERSLREVSAPFAFSPDGARLAAVTQGGVVIMALDGGTNSVKLQNSDDLIPKFGPPGRAWTPLAFSADGTELMVPRNILSPVGVFVLGIWDAMTGAELATMPDDPEHIVHTGMISSMATSPDGKFLVTGSLDHSIRIWSLEQRKLVRSLQGNLSEVWSVAWPAGGHTIISGAKDGSIRLWPAVAPRQQDSFPGTWLPLAFSPDSRKLAAVNRSNQVAFINLATQEPEEILELAPIRFGPPGGPQMSAGFRQPGSVSLSADLKVMAEGMGDGDVRIWNTQTRATYTLSADRPGPRHMMAAIAQLSPDGRELVAGGMGPGGGMGSGMTWWDLRAGTNVVIDADAHRAVFSPDSKILALVGRDETLDLWSTETRTWRTNISLNPPPGFAIAFSADSKFLAISAGRESLNDSIRLWDVARGRLIGTFTGHKQPVFSLAFSSDGRTLASASDDSTLKLWNVATRQELLTIRKLGGALNNLLFSPDDTLLVGSHFQGAELRFCRAPSSAAQNAKDGTVAP
jgi:WD40 repeat protein